MRLRIVALVVAASSLVLVSFLVPLALVLRTLAADHATPTATVEAQSMAPLVTTLSPRSLRLAVAQVNAENNTPVTVFLPACADVLLENVFTHTPEGTGLAVRLSHRAGGGAWLVVADDGPGSPPKLITIRD